jgi:hypothetical protein
MKIVKQIFNGYLNYLVSMIYYIIYANAVYWKTF